MRRDRNSVIGFTEAELGLVLALVALALWLTAVSRHGKIWVDKTTLTELQAQADSSEGYRRRADSIRAANDSLAAQLGLQSNQVPRCTERGYSRDIIATVRIIDDEHFVMNGTTMAFADILRALAPQLEWAEQHDHCRHALQLKTDSAIPKTAFRRLRQRFNTVIE